MKTSGWLAALIFGSMLSVAARADFVYESFDYPYASNPNNQLVQRNGGTGFSSAWFSGAFNANSYDFRIGSGSLSFGGLSISGNSVFTLATQGINGVVRTTAQNLMGDGLATHYLSFLIRRDSATNSGNEFAGMYVHGTGGDLFVGKGGGSPNWLMENRGGGGTAASNVAATVGSTALLVVKMQSVSSANDVFTLYVNPNPGQGEPAVGVTKGDLDVGTANTIVLYNNGAYTFDEIRVGNTFASVTPSSISSTPEPSTLLLTALGLAPVVASRIRKRCSKLAT